MNAPTQVPERASFAPRCGDADLARLPADVAAACRQVLALGGLVDVWSPADGRTYAAVWNLGDPPGHALFAELLATPGWGAYTNRVAVWGWSQPGGAR